jgi:putative lipoprotein
MAGWCRTVSVLIGLLGLSSVLSAAEPPVRWKFECTGNEPFWRVEANDATAKMTRPAAQGIEERVFQGGFGRVDYLQPPWTVWRGVETKEPIAVLVAAIREESCQDSMSGEAFDHRAIVSLPGEGPLAGCCRAVAEEGQTPAVAPEAAKDEIYGRSWFLEQMEGRKTPDPPRLFIASDGKVSGSAGCNQFGGQAAVAGGSLRLGPLISTRRACADQELMDREQRFLGALERARSWRIEQGRLLLLNAEGAELLRFRREE